MSRPTNLLGLATIKTSIPFELQVIPLMRMSEMGSEALNSRNLSV